jgi:hypothetical protein
MNTFRCCRHMYRLLMFRCLGTALTDTNCNVKEYQLLFGRESFVFQAEKAQSLDAHICTWTLHLVEWRRSVLSLCSGLSRPKTSGLRILDSCVSNTDVASNVAWAECVIYCTEGCSGRRRRKYRRTGENDIMRSFMICAHHQMLFS